MPVDQWGLKLPTLSELPTKPYGVVLHWTGGGSRANSTDLAAYHYVVEQDGTARAGIWPVSANMRRLVATDKRYAMHAGGYNSFRIGISAAGMKGYLSRKEPGLYPITEVQIERIAEMAAYFLKLARLDPTDPGALCTHREIWTIHRIRGQHNHEKTDIEFLPFRPELGSDEVGDYLRSRAASYMSRDSEPVAPPPLRADPEPKLSIPLTQTPLTSEPFTVPPPDQTPSLWSRFRSRIGF